MNNSEPLTNRSPETFTGLRLAEPAKTAAGITAVVSSFRHILGGTNFWRGNKALLKLNQKDGFDCPSCAWPDPDGARSLVAEYCESGAKAVADEVMTSHTASPVLFQRYSVAELSGKSEYWLGQQGRLTHPMIRRPGGTHYEKISWADAFQFIGQSLNGLASPNEAVFYTSGRTSNEAAFLYQLFVRAYGTNNLPDCSNMCHESTTEAMTETLGLGKASVKLDDFEKAEVIVIMGQNPGTNAPRMLTALEAGKRNGAKIIAINPLIETGLLAFRNPQGVHDLLTGGTDLSDLYLQLRTNTDMQLLKALMKLLLDAEAERPGEVLDQEFIAQKTTGFSTLKDDLARYSLDDLSAQCGVSLDQLRAAADLLARHKRIIFCWAMGLTQHKNAVQGIRDIVNVLLLKGSIGIPGAGACPVRGHSNVQGDRTMGIYEKPKPAFLDQLKEVFGFEPPREPGFSTVEAVQAMHSGQARVFFGLGGNFASAVSDTDFTAEALRRCELTVQVSTKLNRSHLVTGKTALILPCLGRSDEDHQASGEQFVTMENTTGVVHQSNGALKPPSEHLLSEPAILAGLAKATLGANTPVVWDELVGNYDRIRDLIEKTLQGFENYNERVRQPGGFYLPNATRQGQFGTPDKKAKFTINEPDVWQLAEGEFLLMTVRSHDQFNTTVYGLNDRYRGVFNERRVLFMNAADIQAAGLQAYQVVDLHSHYPDASGVPQRRTARRFIVVPYNIPTRCLAAYFPETNPLIPIDQYAERSQTPISKSVRVTVAGLRTAEGQAEVAQVILE
ncbi:MAG: FdhF/YdeP family oxidoreductase [Cytophagaceae bacterium]|nr:FdhF/YdeP family oxidoreductase [Cytophagaceae bacterium]